MRKAIALAMLQDSELSKVELPEGGRVSEVKRKPSKRPRRGPTEADLLMKRHLSELPKDVFTGAEYKICGDYFRW